MSAFAEIPSSVTTPDTVETSIGTLRFADGIPDAATCEKVYDHLDLTHGVNAYLAGLPGVSVRALRQGFLDAGVADNTVLLYSGLMDSASLFLTGNADTVYFLSFLDLTDGPVTVTVPPECLGTINDMWFRWVIDFGLPGPDRGAGGTYVLLPPGYEGPEPEGGVFVQRCTTWQAIVLGRAFLEDSDPAPTVARIKETLRISPYTPGGYGSSIASFLQGRTPLAPSSPIDPPPFTEGTGLVINTLPPNDYSFYELLDTLVQEQPAESADPEAGGAFREIGIAKGHDFTPDDRMRRLLEDAVAIGNASGRTVGLGARQQDGFAYYEGSAWFNPLFVGGYDWSSPPPRHHPRRGAAPRSRLRAGTELPHRVLLHRHRRLTRDVHAPDRRRIPVPDGRRGLRRPALRRGPPLPADTAGRHPRRPVLVLHPVRQPNKVHAPDLAALPLGRQPELPRARRHREPGRHHHPPPRPRAPRQRGRRHLDPNHTRQGLVRHPAPLQPQAAVLRQDVAAKRSRPR